MNKLFIGAGVIILAFLIIGGGILLFLTQKSEKPVPENTQATETVVTVGEKAPEVAFVTFDGKELRLSQLKGKPVMLWFTATWCPTCWAGAQVLAERISEIEKYNLQIVVLKLFENLGYPGISIEEWGRKFAGDAFFSKNWFFGDASRETSFLYDPKGFPDIYFLIDKEGVIRAIDTAPSATIEKIINFSKSP